MVWWIEILDGDLYLQFDGVVAKLTFFGAPGDNKNIVNPGESSLSFFFNIIVIVIVKDHRQRLKRSTIRWDRNEILVGSGDLYLQFDDDDENEVWPFWPSSNPGF